VQQALCERLHCNSSMIETCRQCEAGRGDAGGDVLQLQKFVPPI
jgi:hypothetical protein